MIRRRTFLKSLAGAVLSTPLWVRQARAEGHALRTIFFYFPDGVAGPSQDGQPSLWHPTGSETRFVLPRQLELLDPRRADCLFFDGLSSGPTDSGSHPGGAKKLLTGVDGGNGESIDQSLARTAGASSHHRHIYLGAQANQNNASGDKHISYPAAGRSTPPEDDPVRAFERLFGTPVPPGQGQSPPMQENLRASVIDAVLDDVQSLRARLGNFEKQKLDLHLESLREVESRLQTPMRPTEPPADCSNPRAPSRVQALYDPANFPMILRGQIDLMVQAMACGLSRVGVIQGSHHTSELIMSRFAGTEMHDPGFDMRSHQASHYGARHDDTHREFADYVKQRRWWVARFKYLLDELAARPEGDGTMLDHSTVVLCSEVCDGNTHLHDRLPFVLAGRAGGAIRTGRFLNYNYERHSNLLVAIARAMGQGIDHFGQASSGPLGGVLG